HHHRPRRLRNRLRLPVLSAAFPGRHRQDRSQLRRQDRVRERRSHAPEGNRRPRRRTRTEPRRRGDRDPGAARRRPRPRLPGRAGLLPRPARRTTAPGARRAALTVAPGRDIGQSRNEVSRVDVAVVGAGITGLAVARELRSRGVGVAVVEREGIAAGASGVQPGGVRQQWGTRVACRLARESVAFWREVNERLDPRTPLELRACGYLFVAESDDTLERLGTNVDLQNEEGVPSRIVGPDEAAALVPGLEAGALAGAAWCADDGYFDRPQAVVEAFAAGLDIHHADVDRLQRDGS